MSQLAVAVIEDTATALTIEVTVQSAAARLPFEAEHALVLHLLAAPLSLAIAEDALAERAGNYITDVETLAVDDAITAVPRVRFRVELTPAGRAVLPLTAGVVFSASLDVRAPLDPADNDVDLPSLDRYAEVPAAGLLREHARAGRVQRARRTRAEVLLSLATLLERDVSELDDLVRIVGEYESEARHLAPLIERRFEHAPHTAALALGRLGAPRSVGALVLALGKYWDRPERGIPRPAALTALAWFGAAARPLAAAALAAFAPVTDYEQLALPLARWRVMADPAALDMWLTALTRTPGYAKPFAKSMVFDAPAPVAAMLVAIAGPALEAARIDTAFERGLLLARGRVD